jgi:hypothetical protein
MRVSTLVLVLALMGGALPAGCVEDVRFNPSGCDVQVRGQWLVDGQNPTAETCGNIALVELAIIDEPEREFWVAPEFTLRCDAETDSNAIVIDGEAFLTERYKSRWRATTDLKFVVDCSPIVSTAIEMQQVDGGTQLLLDVGTVDFQTADGGVVCPQP